MREFMLAAKAAVRSAVIDSAAIVAMLTFLSGLLWLFLWVLIGIGNAAKTLLAVAS